MKKSFIVFSLVVSFLSVQLYAIGKDEVYQKPDNRAWWGKLFEHYFNYKGYEKSYALVVGISRYKSESYLATEQDPIKMKNYLIDEAGFDYVHLLTEESVTKSRVGHLMDNVFAKELKENDRFVLYWSGHGKTRVLPRGDKRGVFTSCKY
jgi:hypothetical protein